MNDGQSAPNPLEFMVKDEWTHASPPFRHQALTTQASPGIFASSYIRPPTRPAYARSPALASRGLPMTAWNARLGPLKCVPTPSDSRDFTITLFLLRLDVSRKKDLLEPGMNSWRRTPVLSLFTRHGPSTIWTFVFLAALHVLHSGTRIKLHRCELSALGKGLASR